MLNQIIEKFSEAVSRRSLIGRIAQACSAVVLAVIGIPVPARAFSVECCSLCSSTLCNGNLSQCAGTWCWTCFWKPHAGRCFIVECTECYNANAPSNCFQPCNGGPLCFNPCKNIICSDAAVVSPC